MQTAIAQKLAEALADALRFVADQGHKEGPVYRRGVIALAEYQAAKNVEDNDAMTGRRRHYSSIGGRR